MFAVRYDMQNMPLCMQNTPAICANEVIGSSAGLVPINALLASVVYPYLGSSSISVQGHELGHLMTKPCPTN
jgi:hypothetical protein